MMDDKVKIVVLDDDPTGTQTVHDIYVYTKWDCTTLEEALCSEPNMFYILTNTRSMSAQEAAAVNREIARNLLQASQSTGIGLTVISRGDSTLRGHYPLETQILYEELGGGFDGEVIAPCFFEGGRYTKDGVHYAILNGQSVPVGETEFAKDPTFGFRSSHLGQWVEEKTSGAYTQESCICLNPADTPEVLQKKICAAKDFSKIIVSAQNYEELGRIVFALENARKMGKRFLYRTAASFPCALAGILPLPPLEASQMTAPSLAGGLVMVGSYTAKTTRQLEALTGAFPCAKTILFHSERVLSPEGLDGEVQRVSELAAQSIENGCFTIVYTQRTPLVLSSDEDALATSVKISDAFTSVVTNLRVKPRFLISKGGITSSQIATDALRIRKAFVLGQAAPGVPVWLSGEESKYPGMPYIIFPGNVGETETLAQICQNLLRKQECMKGNEP